MFQKDLYSKLTSETCAAFLLSKSERKPPFRALTDIESNNQLLLSPLMALSQLHGKKENTLCANLHRSV